MKDTVNKMKSFLVFDFPLQADYIKSDFAAIHNKSLKELPEWSTTATRQRLISKYWFTYVAGHFAVMLGIPVCMIYLAKGFDQPDLFLLSVLIAGLLSYPVLYLFHYRPYFSSLFLPRLEMVKEAFECKQKEQLEKCRQAQLSNLALSLVFYVFDKTSKLNALQCNDQTAGLLMKLYGVDKGSIKKNLGLILGKKRGIQLRKSTEIRKRFEEAYTFFEELHFEEGIRLLKELEMKFKPAHLV